MKSICYSCEQEAVVRTVVAQRTTMIKGLYVAYTDCYFECETCGERSWGPDLPDPIHAALAAYQKITKETL